MKQLNWYQIFGNTHTVPEGSTVTPTDDVQILLHCANIWDKSYTTIGEVIADDDTLFLTLIDNNAIDYLVRSTTFASSIVTSESAMQYIGASDYASETLLSDSTWLTAIDGSAYKDYVINASVPTMTSDTTPSGKCFSGVNYSSSYPAYLAFDKNNSTYWFWGPRGANNNYVGYKFTRPTKIFNMKALFIKERNPTNVTLSIQGSVDGENDFVELTTFDTSSWVTGNNNIAVPLVSTTNYLAYRVLANGIMNQANYTTFTPAEINFYGRENAGVQTWLKAGGVEGKKYTTVSEVLSDLTTLATLMSSTDAIDYLVTAKGWATEICSDSNAMADIGMNNYAANTLLADETWREAICNSTYFESVLNVKVPTMTSNTAPYGEAFGTERTANTAYIAFDNNTSNYAQVSNYTGYLGYKFTRSVTVYKVYVYGYSTSKVGTVEASSDNLTWNTICNFNDVTGENTRVVTNPLECNAYRINLSMSGNYPSIVEAQFYGRKDI